MRKLLIKALPKIEIAITVVLFFAMLVTCGLYLNVKMNGNKSALPELPEKDKRLILRSGDDLSTSFADDLIEPVFVGVKNDDKMIAAIPDDESRRTIEQSVYSPLVLLFSGTSSEMIFDSDESRIKFIQNLKEADRYMLICFYCDMPSAAFLPCLTNSTSSESSVDVFNIRSIFLLPDENDNLYAVAVSSDYQINVLCPVEDVPFGKISAQTYDISDGWSYFDYSDSATLVPELTSSLVLNKYQLRSVASVYGKTNEISWVNDCLDLFSVNSSLVKSFSADDGYSVNYVDEINEISFSDNGDVEFKSLDGFGINLDKYLGYLPDEGMNYSFADKILAVKKLVNELDVYNDNVSYCISGFEYNDSEDLLKVYFKFMCDGILISDDEYHACFEITDNFLTYAYFKAVICNPINDFVKLMPQGYSNMLFAGIENDTDDNVLMPVMFEDEDNSEFKTVKWARISSSAEVIE